jgi:hypothetical protein
MRAFRHCTAVLAVLALIALHPNIGRVLQAINGIECSGNINCRNAPIQADGTVAPFKSFEDNYRNGLAAGCFGAASLNGAALAQSFGASANPPSLLGRYLLGTVFGYPPKHPPAPRNILSLVWGDYAKEVLWMIS